MKLGFKIKNNFDIKSDFKDQKWLQISKLYFGDNSLAFFSGYTRPSEITSIDNLIDNLTTTMSYDYIRPSGLIAFIKWTTENYTGPSEIISFDNSTTKQIQNNDLKPVFQKPLHTDDTDTKQWFETRVSETTAHRPHRPKTMIWNPCFRNHYTDNTDPKIWFETRVSETTA